MEAERDAHHASSNAAPVEMKLTKGLREAVKADELTACNMKFSIDADFWGADEPKPVKLPSEQVKNMHSKVAQMAHFEEQKAWVGEMLKDKGATISPSAIVRPVALRQVRTLISQLGGKLALPATGTQCNPKVAEVLAPNFWRALPGGGCLQVSTDFCLPEVWLAVNGAI